MYQHTGGDDGLLQVREIRNLHLNARMVTLSACDTGIGPVGQTGHNPLLLRAEAQRLGISTQVSILEEGERW